MPEALIVRTVRIPRGLDKEIEALSGLKFSEFVRRMCVQNKNRLQAEAAKKEADK